MAQDRSLMVDAPVTITLGDSPVWLSYEGAAGEILNITTQTAITGTSPDTTLEVLYPNGKRLAYADDTVLADGTIRSDASLQNLELSVAGIYRIRVDSFNGVSEGLVEVIITQQSEAYNELATDKLRVVRGDLPKQQSLSYTVDVPAGTSLSIIARDSSGTLDPVLRVYDANGALIAFNDDHQSDDLSLDILDARLTNLTLTDDGPLTIVVSDYLGRSGSVELMISS